MLSVVAHQGGPGAHVGLWSHWSTDPTVLVGLFITAWAYRRGSHRRTRSHRRRAQTFCAGMLAVAVALVSPLDALAADLASAHMVQHVLLVAVGAPLLAYSSPFATLVRGAPPAMRPLLSRASRVARRVSWVHALLRPGVVWFLHAASLWFWHASVPYGAALEHDAVHAAEHATFLLTALLFWSTVLRVRGPSRVSDGYGALLVFTMAMQGVFLAALLTFATSPWYEGYLATTAAWDLDPLADQQLAGVIMWVPAGLVYVAVGIGLIARWVRSSDGTAAASDFDADWAGRGNVATR